MTDLVHEISNACESFSTLNGPDDSQLSSSVGGRDDIAEISSCRTRIRQLEAEVMALKRFHSLVEGVTDQDELLKRIETLLIEAETAKKMSHQFEELCAKKERENSTLRKQLFDELDKKEREISATLECAKKLKERNEELEVLYEQCAKVYHPVEDSDDPRPSIENADLNDKLQMELQDRMEEINLLHKNNEELVQKLSLFENQFAGQQKIGVAMTGEGQYLDRLTTMKMAEEVCSTDVNSKYSDIDYVIANLFVLMETLSKNGRETQQLQSEITEFLRQRGFEANKEHVNVLTSTFRESYAKHRDLIRKQNMIYEAMGMDNSELRQNLHDLQNDSICSSNMSFAAPNEPGRNLFTNSFADMIRIAGGDLFNKTVELNKDLGTVTERMSTLRQVCTQLFEKLRGTAEFLNHLLDTLGETEEGRELLNKIKDLQFDLNKSIGEARFITDDIKKTEKSLAEFCDAIGQPIELESLANLSRSVAAMHPLSMSALGDAQISSAEIEELKEEIQRLKQLQPSELSLTEIEKLKAEVQRLTEFKDSLKATLKDELAKKQELQEEVERLNSALSDYASQIATLEFLLTQNVTAVEQLNQAIKSKDTELEKKQANVDCMEKERQKFCKLLEKSREEVSSTQEELQTTITLYAELTDKLKAKDDVLSEKEVSMKQMTATVENLRQRCKKANEENDYLQRHIKSLNTNIEKLTKECDQMKAEKELTNVGCTSENVMNSKDIVNMAEPLSLDETIIGEEAEEEKVDDREDFEKFTNFLKDCVNHANISVQLLKNAGKMTKEAGQSDIPYYDKIIKEMRDARLMLYKISKFFDEQKENFKKLNKNLGREIRAELDRIYQILASSSQSLGVGVPRTN